MAFSPLFCYCSDNNKINEEYLIKDSIKEIHIKKLPEVKHNTKKLTKEYFMEGTIKDLAEIFSNQTNLVDFSLPIEDYRNKFNNNKFNLHTNNKGDLTKISVSDNNIRGTLVIKKIINTNVIVLKPIDFKGYYKDKYINYSISGFFLLMDSGFFFVGTWTSDANKLFSNFRNISSIIVLNQNFEIKGQFQFNIRNHLAMPYKAFISIPNGRDQLIKEVYSDFSFFKWKIEDYIKSINNSADKKTIKTLKLRDSQIFKESWLYSGCVRY